MLFIKMLNDIKKNIISFAAIWAMAFACLTITSGFFVVDSVYLNKYIKETNFRDIDVSGAYFNRSDMELIEAIKGITRVEGYYNTEGKLLAEDEIRVCVSYITGNEISKFYLVEGEAYEKDSPGMWVDYTMAKAKGIKVGDVYEITTEDNILFQEVRGLVYSPQYIMYYADTTYLEPNYSEYGYILMDEGQRPNGELYNMLLLDIDMEEKGVNYSSNDRDYIERIKKEVKERLDKDTLILLNREQHPAIRSYISDINTSKVMGRLFPLVFAGSAVLGILSTMSRIIFNQRTEIGTLKALGYTKAKILFHYTSYSAFLVLSGSIAGVITGYNTIGPSMLRSIAAYYLNPFERRYLSPAIIFQICTMTLLAIIVGIMCTWKIVSLPAAEVLRPKAPENMNTGWYENLFFWKNIKFATRWNIRDIATNPMRTIMNLIGIIICSAMMFSSFAYLECFSKLPDWSYKRLINAKYRIEFSPGTDYETVYDYAMEYDGQMMEKREISLHLNNQVEGYYLTVIDKGNLFHLNNSKGEYIHFPENGSVLTEKASDVTGIPLNVLVSFNIYGDNHIFRDRITTLNNMPFTQGIVMTREHYESLNGDFNPNYVYTLKPVPKDLEDRPEVSSVTSGEELHRSVKDMIESNYETVMVSAVMAVFLGVVMMLNMGFMSYNEKKKDIVVLKTLGFGSKELKKLLMQQNFYLTLIGCFIGFFVGFPILNIYVSFSGEMRDFLTNLSPMPYLVDICVIFVLSIVINMQIVSKVDGLELATELKEIL